MNEVIACIDGSACNAAVCDYAAWASARLGARLTLLHVLDERPLPAEVDFSGVIGLGSRELLLEELADADAQRARQSLEYGDNLLQAALVRVQQRGVADAQTRQRHGLLSETLEELEDTFGLLVLGRQGEHGSENDRIGSQLEPVVRNLHRPVLVASGDYREPRSVLFAFDGGEASLKAVETLAALPLLAGLPVHLLMVAGETQERRDQLDMVAQVLEGAGMPVTPTLREGDVEEVVPAYQQEYGLDLLVMGAFGHSRLRQLLMGSTTRHLLHASSTPLLLLH